jgi:alkanesulfonate monooxygenase SsuD/methylene tetrahydromethanopterin reductase-like flavin-dependent oxidoreductase (luciferase family)
MTRQTMMIGFHDAVVGGPKEVADKPEELFGARACAGFVIAATLNSSAAAVPQFAAMRPDPLEL